MIPVEGLFSIAQGRPRILAIAYFLAPIVCARATTALKKRLIAVRASTIVMTAFALVFGLLAVFIANMWLSKQAANRVQAAAPAEGVPSQTVVVASQPLRFGIPKIGNDKRMTRRCATALW